MSMNLGVVKRGRLGIDTRLHLVPSSESGQGTLRPASPEDDRSPTVATSSEGSDLADALSSAPDPYKVATGFLIDSYERTIQILEAERDYLEARLQRAEGKS